MLMHTGTETIRINNFQLLKAVGPNRTFIHPVSAEKPDEFTVDLALVSHKPSAAFTYRVHLDEQDFTIYSPILLKPAWKYVGEKLGLVIEYALNPAFSSDAIRFNNLCIVGKYTGAGPVSVKSRPTGTHYREHSTIIWRLGDVTLGHEWHKITAIFAGPEGSTVLPDHAESRWEVHRPLIGNSISISKLEAPSHSEEIDPFADESLAPTAGKWVDVEINKKIAAAPGMYLAKQTTK